MAYTTIDNPTSFFETLTWTGDGTSPRTLSGLQFQPDWVWGKRRDDAAGHNLFDSVRTAGSDKNLQSNGNGAEGSGSPGTYGYLSAFTSDGFTVTAGSSDNAYWNNNTATYVSWNWLAGGASSSNSDGDVTSTVSANQTAGFSVALVSNLNSNSFGHGLGAEPDLIIGKRTDNTANWRVYFKGITSGKSLFLNTTGGETTESSAIASANSTTITVTGSGNGGTGGTGTAVYYSFKSIKGFSKIGSYQGNGNADGPFVHIGFKPAWVLIKRKDSTNSWQIIDNKRNSFNLSDKLLFPDLSDAESTSSGNAIDMLSNGFKPKGTGSSTNSSGAGYLYMAFAENPFVTEGTKAAGTAR